MKSALVLLVAALAGCTSGPDGAVPLSQYHPLSREYHLWGVLDDGRIHPAWGVGHAGAPPVPDTLAGAHRSLLDLLGTDGPDTTRANVAGTLAGFSLCPPCEPGFQCEPCGPDAAVLEQTVDGGRVLGWFELPTPRSNAGLRVGRRVVATVEVVRGDDGTARRLLGLSTRPPGEG